MFYDTLKKWINSYSDTSARARVYSGNLTNYFTLSFQMYADRDQLPNCVKHIM